MVSRFDGMYDNSTEVRLYFIKLSKNEYVKNNMLPYTSKIIDVFEIYKSGKGIKEIKLHGTDDQ